MGYDILMKIKNTICFILLLFLMLGVASATNSNNETLTQPTEHINQTNDHTLKLKTTDQPEPSKGKEYMSIIPLSSNGKIKTHLKAPDIKTYYTTKTKFTITLKDSIDRPVKKAPVKIQINGKTYSKTTDNKGKIILNLNLKSGKYPVTSTYTGDKKYEKTQTKSTITVKSTIKCSDLTKYYKNKAPYSATFYDKKGKKLKEKNVKFKINSKTYTFKTTKKGTVKLNINSPPGTYHIENINPQTDEKVTRTITIKSPIQTKDLSMNESDNSKFTAKILNTKGKASPNKIVVFRVDGKTYASRTNTNGIASLTITLNEGKYIITTEYDGLINTNLLTVTKGVTHTPFSHTISIPSYVNITYPYVFHNSAYTVKTGYDGILRMPKNEVFIIQTTPDKDYVFSQASIPGVESTVIGYYYHLIPFNGGEVVSDLNKENIKEDGILIYSTSNWTTIEYKSVNEYNTDLFGVYLSKGADHREIITYVQNNRIMGMVNFYTANYDELGLKYNLAKYLGKTIYDINYNELNELDAKSIRFANTNTSATFSYFGNYIAGYPDKEEINTKLLVNGKEEFLKKETISYGLCENYNPNMGYEVLQSYAITHEEINEKIIDNWISKNPGYLNRRGIMNVYSMFMASLSTIWMADEFANNYAREYNVSWKRTGSAIVLGGMNIDKTYLHILNADMGMSVKGDNVSNVKLFKLVNSLALPDLENIALNPVSETFTGNTTSALGELFMNHTSYSLIYSRDLALIDIENSTTKIIINQSSGVVNVLMSDEDFTYKGAVVETSHDCCSCNQIGSQILNNLKNPVLRSFIANPLADKYLSDHSYEIGLLAQISLPYILKNLGVSAGGVSGLGLGLLGFALKVQSIGNAYRNQQDKKDWYFLMDTFTFTRPGITQQKKVYNIPNNKGGYDYVEAPIKSDFSLDRDNTLYISNGNVKKLTKKETYDYYTDDYYTLYNVPPKYWN